MNTCNFVDYLDFDLHLDYYQLYHTPIIQNFHHKVLPLRFLSYQEITDFDNNIDNNFFDSMVNRIYPS